MNNLYKHFRNVDISPIYDGSPLESYVIIYDNEGIPFIHGLFDQYSLDLEFTWVFVDVRLQILLKTESYKF